MMITFLPEINEDILSFFYSIGVLLLSVATGIHLGRRIFRPINLFLFLVVDAAIVAIYMLKFGG